MGQYRFVWNPMYIGVLLVLLGEAALFRSASLLMYTAAFAVFFHLFVVLYKAVLGTHFLRKQQQKSGQLVLF